MKTTIKRLTILFNLVIITLPVWAQYISIPDTAIGRRINGPPHTDCKGSGVTDARDTTTIPKNADLAHVKTATGSPQRSGILDIRMQFSKKTTAMGDSISVSLLGDSFPITPGIRGFAFSYHHDPLASDSTCTSLRSNNYFEGTGRDRISIRKDLKKDNTAKAVVTGINHINRSGDDEKTLLRHNITTDNINAADKDANTVTLNASTDSNQVAHTPTGIRETDIRSHIGIYPNPATNLVTIKAPSGISSVTIIDVLGQQVLTQKINNKLSDTFDISDLQTGVYTVYVSTIDTAKLIITR